MTTASNHLVDPTEVLPAPDLAPALRRLAEAAVSYAEAKRDAWIGELKGVTEPASRTDQAAVAGLKAWATGHNPVSAALRAVWAGADGKTKVAIVATLVLVAVLSPVLLLLLLLALLITALVLKLRAAPTAG